MTLDPEHNQVTLSMHKESLGMIYPDINRQKLLNIFIYFAQGLSFFLYGLSFSFLFVLIDSKHVFGI